MSADLGGWGGRALTVAAGREAFGHITGPSIVDAGRGGFS
jgi:hypothetical protein